MTLPLTLLIVVLDQCPEENCQSNFEWQIKQGGLPPDQRKWSSWLFHKGSAMATRWSAVRSHFYCCCKSLRHFYLRLLVFFLPPPPQSPLVPNSLSVKVVWFPQVSINRPGTFSHFGCDENKIVTNNSNNFYKLLNYKKEQQQGGLPRDQWKWRSWLSHGLAPGEGPNKISTRNQTRSSEKAYEKELHVVDLYLPTSFFCSYCTSPCSPIDKEFEIIEDRFEAQLVCEMTAGGLSKCVSCGRKQWPHPSWFKSQDWKPRHNFVPFFRPLLIFLCDIQGNFRL